MDGSLQNETLGPFENHEQQCEDLNGYKLQMNQIYHVDCLLGMQYIESQSIPFILTDIPYAAVNRKSHGLRNLDKQHADQTTFDLHLFTKELYRINSNSLVIFCGKEQFSNIYNFFASKKRDNKTHCLGEVESMSYEWSICVFKWSRNGYLV
ncbi:hypothetical protein NHP21005_10590 [Helicobacter sp. NHP21005]|uniref:hypothetical protein n=1 Tax=Helicobacter felistomachi TaxID=3040201 RepID=UPI00257429FE|nr:hypothetical protein [Helicobacter sp. NHP21005]BEG57371.1 hypothetical protein NHP21005_10590 [Helicobacter sp. NHP21005]